jgi:hypothetical protein
LIQIAERFENVLGGDHRLITMHCHVLNIDQLLVRRLVIDSEFQRKFSDVLASVNIAEGHQVVALALEVLDQVVNLE